MSGLVARTSPPHTPQGHTHGHRRVHTYTPHAHTHRLAHRHRHTDTPRTHTDSYAQTHRHTETHQPGTHTLHAHTASQGLALTAVAPTPVSPEASLSPSAPWPAAHQRTGVSCPWLFSHTLLCWLLGPSETVKWRRTSALRQPLVSARDPGGSQASPPLLDLFVVSERATFIIKVLFKMK